MRSEPEKIAYIQNAFQTMKSREDLLDLLNYAKKIIFGEKTIPFQIKQLTYYSNPKIARKRYVSFTVKKKSGGDRQINAPVKGLKSIQRSLNLILQAVFTPHPAATGFANSKSILDNALFHAGHNYVYNIDLKDFFPSIDQARIWKCLQLKPFNLTAETDRLVLANMMASLCCSSMEVERQNIEGQWQKTVRNVLPQGAPTSPLLTNVICQKLDFLLAAVARRFGLIYSRYADDITFSSNHNVYQKHSDFLREVDRIITQQGFSINQSKTRLQKEGYRQEVTGLIVNEKPNVQRRYIKKLRSWLYLWETYGYEKANECFLNDYMQDKGHVKKGQPNMINVIGGKLEYLKMVKGKSNLTYIKLCNKYQALIPKENLIKETVETQTITITNDQINIPFQNNQNDIKNQVELTLKPLGTQINNKIKLYQEKIINEGVELPFKEVFENLKKSKKFLPHNPDATSNFLIQFKMDESGFKELVHIPNETILPSELLEKVKNHTILSRTYKRKNKPGFRSIHISVWKDTVSLVNLFEEKGIPYWESHGIHPFGKDGLPEYTKFVLDFKQKYRFGPSKEGYTSLADSINKIFLEKVTRFNFALQFQPDKRIFEIRASFYTWVPSIEKGLKYIAENINSHSNLNGVAEFDSKEIRFEIKRNSEANSIILTIIDMGSICLRNTSDVLNDFRRSEVCNRYFRSLCDWSILLNDSKDSYQLNVLKKIEDISKEDIQLITETPEGFTHVITFYGT